MNMPVDLVTLLCQHLASKPEAIKVQASIQGRVRHIEIRSAPEDAGRLIGRAGRVINGIRLIAQAANTFRDRIEIHYIDTEHGDDPNDTAETYPHSSDETSAQPEHAPNINTNDGDDARA